MTYTPRFTTTNAITAALTKIERARGFLEAAKLSEDWISQMQQRALVLEAHHTTHIEGSHLSLEESELLLAGKKVRGADPDDVRELLNYRKAFELVADCVAGGEAVSEDVIQAIHRRLVSGVRGDSAKPGEYRQVQNCVVNARREVVYTPPAPKKVPGLMKELVAWLQSKQETHPVLVAGAAQFQFVDIHPFIDGNGRTARLLSTLCLYGAGYDFKRLFTISEYYDRDRPAYYQAIRTVRQNNGDLTAWLEYFVDGLSTQMREVQEKGERVIRRDALALRHGLSKRQRVALGLVLDQGSLAPKDLQGASPKATARTWQRELGALVEMGLLVTEGATKRRIYKAAPGI